MNPLATLAIFAYNQEEYIQEAIEGAFSQTYTPLQIILSDDCSSDQTFEIMRRAVLTYSGPHDLILNKTNVNLNMVGHVFSVVHKASGDLIVVAAGDDISKSNRVDSLVKTWLPERPAVVFSAYDSIDDSGRTIAKAVIPSTKNKWYGRIYAGASDLGILGATAAYSTSFLRELPVPCGRFYFEDTYLNAMAKLFQEEIRFTGQSLVEYRTHRDSVSNSSGTRTRTTIQSVLSHQVRAAALSANKFDLYNYLIKLVHDSSGRTKQYACNVHELQRLAKQFWYRGAWIDVGFPQRLGATIANLHDVGFLKFAIPRLFGLRVFAVLRSLQKRLTT